MNPLTRFLNLKRQNKRLFNWIILYTLIFFVFLGVIFWQAKNVNTLEFPSGVIDLSVNSEKYTLGQTITYTLTNQLVNSITLVSNCPKEPFETYVWESSQWVRIHDTATAAACKTVSYQVMIPPGKSLSGNFSNWPNLFNKPGIYRIVAFANNYPGLPYADFQVVSP